MTESIIVFVWLNIGIAWALHMGTDVSTFWERILIQVLIIFWPLSMFFWLISYVIVTNKRRIARLQAKEGQAHKPSTRTGHTET